MISFFWLALSAWAGLAAVSFFIDPTVLSGGASLCLFKFWWGISCPGCGMGRALLSAFQMKWAQSIQFHPLGLPLLMVWTLWLAFESFPQSIQKKIPPEMKGRVQRTLLWGAAAGLILVEAARWCGYASRV